MMTSDHGPLGSIARRPMLGATMAGRLLEVGMSHVFNATVLALSLWTVAIFTSPEQAVAGNRLADCGGPGQCSCNIAQAIPSCDLWSSEVGEACGILNLQRTCVAVTCGEPDQRSCEPFVDHSYSATCRPGLFAHQGLCRALDSDGYPSHCGGDGEPACTVTVTVPLGITPCKAAHYDDNFPAVGTCRKLGVDGYPPACGHHGETPCGAQLIGSLAVQGAIITPCAPGFVRKGDICVGIGLDANAPRCGGRGEPACTLDQQLARLVPACQPGLEELYLPLGSCFPRADLSRPPPHRWPDEEAAPGPRSVFLIHGMTGSVNSFAASPGALAAVLRANGHRVFNVDYNADGDTARGLHLYELSSKRWRLLGVYGKPLSGTTLSIGDVASNLRDAILKTDTGTDIAIVGHSMGGLVARNLVQKHYDELRLAGKRVAEVITLGSPHTGGGFGIPEITTARGMQGVAMCWGLRALDDPQLRRVSYQACMMDRWHEEREKLPPGQVIDNRDFPQIRWVAVAGSNQLILNRSINAAYEQIQTWLNANLGLGLNASIAEVDSDSLVAVSSAFGIQVDSCFPHRHDEPPANLPPLVPDGDPGGPKLRRTMRMVSTQPLYSAECFLPAAVCGRDERYPHLTSLENTDHQYQGRRDVIAFVAATLTPAHRAPGVR